LHGDETDEAYTASVLVAEVVIRMRYYLKAKGKRG
jgi:hypothetical protein